MTAKQAAAQMRKHLKTVAAGHTMAWKLEDDAGEYMLRVPAGLRFEVRATQKHKVNVTICDDGYVDAVTNGDRRAFGKEHAEPVVETIREYQRALWGEEIGKVEWGPIIIGVSNVRSTGMVELGGDAA